MTADTGTPESAAVAADGRADGATGDAATRDDARRRPPRLVFCGGCNPHIDRGAVAAELAAAHGGGDATSGDAVKTGSDGGRGGEGGRGGARPTVYLSGCARACASDHRLTGDAPGDVVVAGEVVDGHPTPRQDIAAAVRQKLKE